MFLPVIRSESSFANYNSETSSAMKQDGTRMQSLWIHGFNLLNGLQWAVASVVHDRVHLQLQSYLKWRL